ncbi:hypothetical protein, partial [uncultured Gammaproteobacteria bacterium]
MQRSQDVLKKAILIDDTKNQAIDLVHKFGEKGFFKY